MSPEVVLVCKNITKEYGVTRALKGVDFEVRSGKVTTLFGENGAGKSTLMKIISGVEQPTSGTIELFGEEVEFADTRDAADRGIAIIHQELSLAPNMTVRDNIFLGREKNSMAGIDFSSESEDVRELMNRLEEDIDPKTLVADLRLGQQQIVEIARALSMKAKILIMDEPTSALSSAEVEVLFKLIDELKSQNVAIIYISHHLEEALEISDYCFVFRDGDLVAKDSAENVDLRWVVRQMIGSEGSLDSMIDEGDTGKPVLVISNYSVADPSNPARLSVNDLSVTVSEGEVVCLYGLMGAGRTELLESLAGRFPAIGGKVSLNGKDLTNKSISQRISQGLVLVPEDRQRDGIVQSMSVGQNLSLAHLGTMVKSGFVKARAEAKKVLEQIADVRVKTSGPKAPIMSLSGGNQQKVVIGKALMTSPKALMLDEPSRGIDVGAKSEVFKLLRKQSKQGMAVLFATSEIGEALNVSSRIIVLRKGIKVGEFKSSETSREELIAVANQEVNVRYGAA